MLLFLFGYGTNIFMHSISYHGWVFIYATAYTRPDEQSVKKQVI